MGDNIENTLNITEQTAAATSALHENINRKGQTSYYYAHSNTCKGPEWDGKEEPRLLSVTTAQQVVSRKVESFDSYSWLDGKKIVKLYVEVSDVATVEAEQITLSSTENSVTLKLALPNFDRILHVGPLNDEITEATYRIKDNNTIIVTMKKAKEYSWYELKKKSKS